MRVVIQRVLKGSVYINDRVHSGIGKGLVILAGFEENDDEKDVEWIANKIVALRIFNDENSVPNLGIMDVNGELLVVSQFTLHASTKKGNRPGYTKAARPEKAIPLYELFIALLKERSRLAVHTGVFGADMQVELVNDGPFTLIMDSKNKE